MKTSRNRLQLVGAVILGLSCFCLGLAIIAPRSRQASPVPTNTPKVTATVDAPTNTPKVTATAEPTITRVPTLTPLPTATETPEATATLQATATTKYVPTYVATQKPSADVKVYASKLSTRSQTCATSLSTLSSLSKLASTSPSLMLSASWKVSMLDNLELMRSSCASLDEIQPVPEIMQASYVFIKLASDEFDQVVELAQDGVINSNPDSIQQATGHMQTAVEYMGLATQALPTNQ